MREILVLTYSFASELPPISAQMSVKKKFYKNLKITAI
jgi:hypothetical protein